MPARAQRAAIAPTILPSRLWESKRPSPETTASAPGEAGVEVESVEDEVGAGAQLGAVGPECRRRARRRAGHRHPAGVAGELGGERVRASRSAARPPRRRPLLRREDTRRVLVTASARRRGPRSPHRRSTSESRFWRSASIAPWPPSVVALPPAATRTRLAPAADRGGDQLAGAEGVGPLRVALLRRQQRQPRGLRHLDDRGLAVAEQRRSSPRSAAAAGRGPRAVRRSPPSAASSTVHRPLAAVGDGTAIGRAARRLDPGADRLGHCSRREGPLEGVRRGEKPHAHAPHNGAPWAALVIVTRLASSFGFTAIIRAVDRPPQQRERRAKILFTVVGQGLTLPLLIRRFDVAEDGSEEEHEELRARLTAAGAALERLDELSIEEWTQEDTVKRVRAMYEFRRRRFKVRAGKIDDEDGIEDRSIAYQRLMHELYAAQRGALVSLRDSGKISAEVMRRVERELDLEEERLEV